MSIAEAPPQAELSDDEKQSLRERFHEHEQNYELLTPDKQEVRGSVNMWESDFLLEEYVKDTERMVGLLDGSITDRAIYDYDQMERAESKPDTVIWLDKSARPVSWFVDAFWGQFAKPGVEKPDFEFLNIDRVVWFEKQGYTKTQAEERLSAADFDINKVTQKDIDSIRVLLVDGDIDPQTWREDIWKLPTRLDGKNVLIVDEVKNKGGTLSIAQQLLSRAVPEATFSGTYFWTRGHYDVGGDPSDIIQRQMDSIPVWYSKANIDGRGIGEISPRYWAHKYDVEPTQANLKKKLGWQAISAPQFDRETFEDLTPRDIKAKKLLQDIAYLTHAVAEGRVRRVPIGRISEEQDDIIAAQGLSASDNKYLTDFRSQQDKTKPRERP